MKTIARSLTLFTVCTSVCLASASAQEVMFATSTYSPANLLTVDPVTGVTLNSLPISGEEALFGGLTRNGTDLYTIDGYNDGNSDRTFKIDSTNGTGTIVGNTNFNWNFRSVDFNPATHVLFATTDNNLYTINTSTGAATLVAAISGATLDQLTCFAINSAGVAYATDTGGTGLFKLDLTTGHVQHLGDLLTSNFFQDLAFDSTDRLWGLMSGGGAYLIDIPTFTPTFQFFTSDWKGITFGGCAVPTVYCTAGTTAAGCATALTFSGNPSATASSGFTVSCNNVDVNRNGLFFYGVTNATFVPTPWGVGGTSYKCIANPVQRMGPMDSGGTTGCTGGFTQDWNAYMANNPTALGNPRAVGASFQLQLWMRDPPSPKSTILSNALEFDLCL
jgi:hypothetical protein